MQFFKKLYNAIMPESRATIVEGEVIPWVHGADVSNSKCFGDDIRLLVDENGGYRITDVEEESLKRFLGCRVTIENRKTTDALHNILKTTDRLFTANNIPYWINSGTLLGFIRAGGVIPWDNDADVLVRWEDIPSVQALIAEVEKEGLTYAENPLHGPEYKMYFKSKETPHIMIEICPMHPRSVNLDSGEAATLWRYHFRMAEAVTKRVEAMYHNDNSNVIGAHRYHQRRNHDFLIDNQYLSEEIFPLRRIETEHVSLNIPNQPEAILQRDYGPTGLTEGVVSCWCQWARGRHLFKVEIVK